MSDRCVSWMGKHSYTPRYDEVPNEVAIKAIEHNQIGISREMMLRKVYICDICAYCGDTIDRIDMKEKE